jgi:hypothetical protein
MQMLVKSSKIVPLCFRVTTAKPAATKKDNVDNELIKQLDDLFQDS